MSLNEKVTNIIVDKLSVEESRVVPEASFLDDLGADSLDTVELIMEFEEEFIQILRNIGSGAKVQSEIKKSYIAYHGGEASHPVMVYSGLIHLINKYSTKDWMLGAPISHSEMNDV